jgi:hypothetical protein
LGSGSYVDVISVFSPVPGRDEVVYRTLYTSFVEYGDFRFFGTTGPEPLPEPGGLLMLSLGVAAVGGMAWHRRRIA